MDKFKQRQEVEKQKLNEAVKEQKRQRTLAEVEVVQKPKNMGTKRSGAKSKDKQQNV